LERLLSPLPSLAVQVRITELKALVEVEKIRERQT
jgi:hypothetical protein